MDSRVPSGPPGPIRDLISSLNGGEPNPATATEGSSILPGWSVLRHYQLSWLRSDVLAGITVAAYLVPQVMAYATIAGLPPVTGLWAAIVPLIIYAFVGTSRVISVGPESTMALMTAAGVLSLAGSNASAERASQIAALLAIAVGVVAMVGYIARLGFISEFLSKPVLVGYLAGVAVLMIMSQLDTVTKISSANGNELMATWDLLHRLNEVHQPTLWLAVGCIVALLLIFRFLPNWPAPLIVIICSTLIVWITGLDQQGVHVVGELPRGLPPIGLPSWNDIEFVALLNTAIGITVVGYSSNMLTARAFRLHNEPRVQTNQECFALGLINLGAGVTGGFPVSSSGSRTVLARVMHAKTQLYSIVSAVTVVLTLVVLAPALSHFPNASLGAIVIVAAGKLVQTSDWIRIAKFRRSELLLAIATTVSVVFLGVLEGIAIAVALSIIELLRRLTKPNDGVLGYVEGVAGMHNIEDYDIAKQVPGLLVYRYDSPLFFANSDDFVTRALAAIDAAPTRIHWFLLNAEANVEIDLTAIDALRELRRQLEARGIVFAMARVKYGLFRQLSDAGFIEKIGEEHIFPTLPAGVQGYADWVAEQRKDNHEK